MCILQVIQINLLLEASVKYKSLNHLITIRVTGSADTPNIHFSSKPTLTKEQILSSHLV